MSIRFYYMGHDWKEGQKYLKPLFDYKYSNLEHVYDKYKKELAFDRHKATSDTNVGRCPGMNSMRTSGYVLLNDEEIRGDESQADYRPVKKFFPDYPNADDYVIVKHASKWRASVPKDYRLLCQPTSYHTRDWTSLPGFLDPSYSVYMGIAIQMNVFFIMKKGDVIPIGSPLTQFHIVKKDGHEVLIEHHNQNDQEKEFQLQELMHNQYDNVEHYRELKRSQLFESED